MPTKISVDNPLQLLIDFKTDPGDATYGVLIDALAPLRDAGYLTTWTSGDGLKQGAVTVVGTGATPIQKVLDADPRDIFYDADLSTLPDSGLEWSPDIGPLASEDWGAIDQREAQQYVNDAHDRGLKTRFWNADSEDWQTMVDIGSDFLNADDLQKAQDWVAEHAA